MLRYVLILLCLMPGAAQAQFAASLVLEAGEDRLVVAPGQVADISAGVAGGAPVVDVHLLHMPAQRLHDMTAAHVGTPMSVQLCQRELTRPVVLEAIQTGRVRLPAPSLAAAETIAAILDGRATCEEIGG